MQGHLLNSLPMCLPSNHPLLISFVLLHSAVILKHNWMDGFLQFPVKVISYNVKIKWIKNVIYNKKKNVHCCEVAGVVLKSLICPIRNFLTCYNLLIKIAHIFSTSHTNSCIIIYNIYNIRWIRKKLFNTLH